VPGNAPRARNQPRCPYLYISLDRADVVHAAPKAGTQARYRDGRWPTRLYCASHCPLSLAPKPLTSTSVQHRIASTRIGPTAELCDKLLDGPVLTCTGEVKGRRRILHLALAKSASVPQAIFRDGRDRGCIVFLSLVGNYSEVLCRAPDYCRSLRMPPQSC